MRGRSVMRRIVLQQHVVLLWAMASEWDHYDQQASMAQDGWMVISPFQELGDSVCLLQSGISMQFFTHEGYVLSTRSPQASNAMSLLRSLGDHQEKVTENRLMDANAN